MEETIVQDAGQPDTNNIGVTQDASVQQGQQATTANEKSSQPVQGVVNQQDVFVEIVPFFTQPLDRPAAVIFDVTVRKPGNVGKVYNVNTYTHPPAFSTANKDLKERIRVLLQNTKNENKGAGFTYTPADVDVYLKGAIAEITKVYVKPEPKEYKKEKEQQEQDKQEQQNKQENEAAECPKCHQKTWSKVAIDGKEGWQCSNPECKNFQEYRLEYPYEFTMHGGLLCKLKLVEFEDETTGKKTKSMVPEPVGDFGIIPMQQIQVEDKVYYKYKITYREKNGGEKIDRETTFTFDSDTLSDSRKFHAALTKVCPDIAFDYYKDTGIRQAFKEIKVQAGNIEKIKKTSDFGWNSDFTGYLTDKRDIRLAGHDDENYFIPDQQNRDGTHNVTSRHREEDEMPEGSVMIDQNDPDLAKMRVTFNEIGDDKLKEVLLHYKNDLLTLHPIMPRVIGLTFAAPLASMLDDLVFYSMYLLGKTGYGKTAIEILMASHFGIYNGTADFINPKDSAPIQFKIGYYHKDLLYVVDNYKENLADKNTKANFVKLMQCITDKAPRRVMGKNVQVRGYTLFSGEEFPAGDASTKRKTHTERLDTPIRGAEAARNPEHVKWEDMTPEEQRDLLQLKRCFNEKQYYSGVMVRYITWLLEQHGTELKQYLHNEYNSLEPKLSDIILRINAIGYKLFLDFMQSEEIITPEEVKEGFETHLKNLQKISVEQKENIQDETTGERFLKAFRAMVKNGKARIQNDPEFGYEKNVNIPRAAIAVNGGAQLGINFEEAYPEIRNYLREYFDLPRDGDSVLRQLREMIKDGKLSGKKSHPVYDPNIEDHKKMLVLDRKSAFPDSTVGTTGDMVLSVKDIMKLINTTGTAAYINNLKEKPNHIEHTKLVHLLLDDHVKKIDDEKIVARCYANAEEALILFYASNKGWDYIVS